MPKRRKQQLKQKLMPLPSTEQTAKRCSRPSFDAFTVIDPAVNDVDGKWRLTVQALQQGQAAVVAAEQAYQDAKDALTTANTDGLINPAEKQLLNKL